MAKEYNPDTNFDAFTAGVEDGGLRSTSSISTICCYLIDNCKGDVTSKMIVDSLVEGKIANYFEITNSISKLINQEMIIENENGVLSLSTKAKYSIDLLENDLPITIREKSIEILTKLLKYEINKKENSAEIKKLEQGYKVILHLKDNNNDFMTLSFFVNSISQAELLKEKFLNNPTKIYENLINSLFEE